MSGRSVLRRRTLLGGAAAGLAVAGCSAPVSTTQATGSATPSPAAPDPDSVLLATVIKEKEQMITLYRQVARSDSALADALAPFERRNAAHLAALLKLAPDGPQRVPPLSPAAAASTTASPATTSSAEASTPSGTSTPSPVPSTGVPSLAELREVEHRAAASRPGQTAAVSPVFAQVLASIGACEAVHALALGRLRD